MRSITRAAVISVALLPAALSLLIPAKTYRNNEGENPPKYDCGPPLSFITGASERRWRIADSRPIPTTVPGLPTEVPPWMRDYQKARVCKEAMAPRLGFTVFALIGALVLVAITLSTVPTRRVGEARSEEGGVP